MPGALRGFAETDEPNFSFRRPPCSFYSGSKALAEEAIAGAGQSYLWRLRIPFDEFDDSKNFLSKIQRYPRVYDNVNSLSHRGDFARACLDLWELGWKPAHTFEAGLRQTVRWYLDHQAWVGQVRGAGPTN
jgi:dTDP-4-dehydrorhamnose reductase